MGTHSDPKSGLAGFEPKTFSLGRKGSCGTQIQDEAGIMQMLQPKQFEDLDKIWLSVIMSEASKEGCWVICI